MNKKGDSGGSLIQMVGNRWHILGIASFGFSGCQLSDPVIYIKVSDYIHWIENAINYLETNTQKFLYYDTETETTVPFQQFKRMTCLIVKVFRKLITLLLKYICLVYKLFSQIKTFF